jgi:hypothetical protein
MSWPVPRVPDPPIVASVRAKHMRATGGEMADLYIDMDGLARTRDNLDRIGDLMKDPVGRMSDEAGDATSIDELRSKMQDFGDEWDYGIGRLTKYTKGVGEALEQIRKTFSDLDQQLADLFTEKQ